MATGWGTYSTAPAITNVATTLAEGVLPPFPEHEEITGEDKKLTPTWRRWFAKQRAWLTDRGAYKPTEIAFTSMGTAAVSGNPVLQWWKQGNIVQIFVDLTLTGVSAGGGSMIIKPLPFDPSNRILTTGAAAGVGIYVVSCITLAATWTTTPCYCVNNKGASTHTQIVLQNVPNATTQIYINGTYITDN